MGRYSELLKTKPLPQPQAAPSTPPPTPAPNVQSSPPLSEPSPAASTSKPPLVGEGIQGGEDIFERIRRTVKQSGREPATYRFTLEEKKALAEIVHAYDLQGVRTSDNQITRISINYLVEDYRRHKDQSILARILQLIHS